MAAVGGCEDADTQVEADTGGQATTCAELSAFCANDAALVAMGLPEGWLHLVCPVTCSLCDIGEGPMSHSCEQ